MEAHDDSYVSRNGEIVDECATLRAEIARLESRITTLLSERVSRLLAQVPPGSPSFDAAERSMLCEVAAGLHITKAAAGRELGAAWMLHDRFARTTTALAEGSISLRHATTIAESAAAIPATDSAALSDYERQVVPFPAAETVARTAAFAQSVSASLVPEDMAERHRRARSGRRVTVTDLDDGMAHLSAILPAVLAHAIHDRLTATGHRLRDDAKAELRARHSDAASDPRCRDAEAPRSPSHRGGRSAQGDLGSAIGCDDADERTLDEVRADILADLLLTTAPTSTSNTALEAIHATVQVTVAATTLAARDQRMAEHDGHGPLLPQAARLLAGMATTWTRLFLDAHGMTVRTDSYTPTAEMRRFLRARDRHCRFPGCRRAARRCEIDHNYDHAKGGRTEISNLCCLCPTHHALKHPDHDQRWRWRAIQRPGGVIDWISPAGKVYTDAAPPRVQFVPSS
ncbi:MULTISPECIES: DUF222 domain-containing protein [Bacteria]|uniref:HNH endonuclease signature motif containing protein n=1 Tax=Bacteria TaxID=2 RepID=UPI003C7E3410